MNYFTNIFPIENLDELSSQYRLINIKGLKRDKDYQSTKQFLIKKFSSKLLHPVTIVEFGDEPKMIIKNDNQVLNKIQTENDFGRIYIHLYPTDEIFNIDFKNPDEQTKEICLRFLQFDLNKELKNSSLLWQPNTGAPFFFKSPKTTESDIAIYRGFNYRVVKLNEGFGIAIDATRKFTSSKPLPNNINKKDFVEKYKKKNFIYQFKNWYEIQATELYDLNVSQCKIEGVSLIDYVRNIIPKPHSPHLANIPNEGSVVNYYTSNNESRCAPAGLCFEVLDFQDTNNREVNKTSIIAPEHRFKEIINYKNNFFQNIRFGNKYLKLTNKPLIIEKKIFSFPDFELGGGNIISQNNFLNQTDIPYKIAKARLKSLMNNEIGFYTKTPLPEQFIVLPRSINDSVGLTFMNMLKDTVNKMYPSDSYSPNVLAYEDKFPKETDYVSIGMHIIETIKSNYQSNSPAYGVVMISHTKRKAKREHDKLGALIIRELKKIGFNCSIIHTDTIKECFNYKQSNEGKPEYFLNLTKEKKFNGYLRGVAINKILLNCNKWPFILREPLISDLTIGIDVKHNTAGFTIIDKNAKNIRTELEETSNKEKLSSDQLQKWLYKIILLELDYVNKTNLRNIVIHRDGRLYETEHEGLHKAINQLISEGYLDPETTLNIIEIPKSSFIPTRVFGICKDKVEEKFIIENPPIGLHFIINDIAFLCSTGKEFPHDGTTNPAYVKYQSGKMEFKNILSDYFKLTTLAYSKPDDCSRSPLTIKINDVKLNDAASEYDEDTFNNFKTILKNFNITTNE